MRSFVVVNTHYFAIVLHKLLGESFLEIELFSDVNKEDLVGGFLENSTELVLDKVSDEKIGVNFEFLFATSIKQFYEDVDFLFIDVGTVNNVDDVLFPKYDWSLPTYPLTLMEQHHAGIFHWDFSLDDTLDLAIRQDFRNCHQQSLLFARSEINIHLLSVLLLTLSLHRFHINFIFLL